MSGAYQAMMSHRAGPLGPPAPPAGVFPDANFVIEAYSTGTNVVGWQTGQPTKINPSSPPPKVPCTSNSGAGQMFLFQHNFSTNVLYLSFASVPTTPNPATGLFVRMTVKDLTTLTTNTYLKSGAASSDDVPATLNYTWNTANAFVIGRQYQVEFFNS